LGKSQEKKEPFSFPFPELFADLARYLSLRRAVKSATVSSFISYEKGGLSMDITELEKQITVLQDIEAVKRLKAEYCDICDDEHNQDRIVSIFAEDGIWEGKGVGYAKGHAELRKLFKNFADRVSFSQHNVFNPRITVNGNEAHASWYFLGPFTFRKDNRQLWLAARYEDDYVKINGQWKFKHLRAFGRMAAPYEEGWASRAKVDVFTNEL
jgi:hypothetical protein